MLWLTLRSFKKPFLRTLCGWLCCIVADCGAGVQANVHYMLLRVFDTFDADGDGFLSKDEIYAMKEATGRRSFGAEHTLTPLIHHPFFIPRLLIMHC